jgi:hypothetical protein
MTALPLFRVPGGEGTARGPSPRANTSHKTLTPLVRRKDFRCDESRSSATYEYLFPHRTRIRNPGPQLRPISEILRPVRSCDKFALAATYGPRLRRIADRTGGIGRRARLRAWWGLNPVQVQVLSPALVTQGVTANGRSPFLLLQPVWGALGGQHWGRVGVVSLVQNVDRRYDFLEATLWLGSKNIPHLDTSRSASA